MMHSNLNFHFFESFCRILYIWVNFIFNEIFCLVLCIRLRASQNLSAQHLRFLIQPYILANAADPYSLLVT